MSCYNYSGLISMQPDGNIDSPHQLKDSIKEPHEETEQRVLTLVLRWLCLRSGRRHYCYICGL
jgi:hypothetical protein